MRAPILTILATILFTSCAGKPGEPRPNLSHLKSENIHWVESGAYAEAIDRAAAPARDRLENYLRGETPQNFAIVLDIDETLLSNWPYLKDRQFAITSDSFAAWTQRERGIPLAPVREIYARAQAYSIPIFLVTGRNESLRAETIRDLESAGIWGWAALFMKPAGYNEPSIIPFKSGVRQMLTDQGFNVIINMGDQESDLAGGYARHSFKLPNPFYYTP